MALAPPPEDALSRVLGRNIPALDGVRGIAILCVLGHELLIEHEESGRVVQLLLAPLQAGWWGVQLFFVLSGFLITGILLDTKHAQGYWSTFMARRALRIFPAYYVVLFLVLIVAPLLVSHPPELLAQYRHQAWYWLYVANWGFLGKNVTITPLAHCWSLALEEQFYLVWPLIVGSLRNTWLLRLCLALSLGALSIRCVGTALHVDPNVLYDATFTRVDALAMGALVATLLREPAWTRAILPRVPRLAMLSGVGLLLVTLASGFLARLNPVTLTLGHTLLAIVSALLVLEVVRRTATEPAGRMIRWLSAPWLRTFGKYSYSIYLIHLPLNLLATRALTPFSDRLTGFVFLGFQLLEVLLGSLLLLGLGWLLHHGVERPFLKLKRFFVVRPAPAREASVLLAPPR